MSASVEFFDHTADMGIRVSAATREELVVGAIDGLYGVIGRLEGIGEPRGISFEFTGEDDAGLLRDLLTEVLFLFEHKRTIVADLEVPEFANGRLRVIGKAQTVDAARSEFQHEVKAITYHELVVRRVADGWEARIIVDI